MLYDVKNCCGLMSKNQIEGRQNPWHCVCHAIHFIPAQLVWSAIVHVQCQ